ncbi:hypothetical protein [Xanthomonas cannabis]|uniref:hypothetical protein n=1 Tax=Xanthomonas cannabis TaxID=1885674 RepID=UPI0005741F1A|nr:hypothetical protein OZ10_04225 [Xanthomonas cannabis pv. cannabis]
MGLADGCHGPHWRVWQNNRLDETTQQNAALVEEATAAARAMEEQSVQLTEAVAVFKVDGGVTRPARVLAAVAPARKAGSRKAKTTAPVTSNRHATKQTHVAVAASDGGNWQEF